MQYVETSARAGINVAEAFACLVLGGLFIIFQLCFFFADLQIAGAPSNYSDNHKKNYYDNKCGSVSLPLRTFDVSVSVIDINTVVTIK